MGGAACSLKAGQGQISGLARLWACVGGLREGKACKDLQPTTVQASSVEHLPHTIRTQPERMFQAAMAMYAKALRQGQAWQHLKEASMLD